MKLIPFSRSLCLAAIGAVVITTLAGCTTDDPSAGAAGPGVENPAAAAPNSIIPAVGTSGNGGGISGGGGGVAGGH